MLSKLPAWVGFGAFSLALAAGAMNVFMLESVVRQAVTHHSGSASNLALSLSRGDYGQSLHFCLLILAFVAGSALSGFIIRDVHLKLGRRYGVCLLLECLAILVAWTVFDPAPAAGQMILSAASGLQNAIATTYSGAVVRTTHLTGIFTDIGILFGNRLAGIPMPERKLKLFGTILAGFLAGGLSSGFLYPVLGNAVLAVPAAISGGIGGFYFVYRYFLTGAKRHAGAS